MPTLNTKTKYFNAKRIVIFNCCLINISDMLDNGTVVNGKMIESPKSFRVACTIMTQIIACVASNQYGGQSVDLCHLGKYLRRSADRIWEKLQNRGLSGVECRALAHELLQEELRAGVQTIQYQINTLMTTNGQSPFVTLFLNIPEGHEYEKEIAMIVEEVLRQRLQGIKNEKGVYITSLGGLHAGANPITGDFSLQSSGFMIEGGKKTTFVKSFTVAGNFYELLKNIVALADNSHLPRAMGSTAFGAPTTLVDGLTVAGK